MKYPVNDLVMCYIRAIYSGQNEYLRLRSVAETSQWLRLRSG
jgi:hypothetical protein